MVECFYYTYPENEFTEIDGLTNLLDLKKVKIQNVREPRLGNWKYRSNSAFSKFKMSAIFTMAAKTRHKIWAVKIQHFPISSKFDIWVDNNVPNLFPTLKHFYRSPFSKWSPQYCKNSTLSDII